MSKVKVLHLTYDMRIGGTESVIKSLIEGLDTSNFEAEVLCIEPRVGPFGEQLIGQGISVSHLNWTGGFSKALIKDIRAYLKNNNINILHCHQYTPWFYGAIAAIGLKVKVIFTEHGRFYPDRSSWKRKYINPLLLMKTTHVTAISDATRQALACYEYIPVAKTKVIYNGIRGLSSSNKSNSLLEALSIPVDALIFGTVARLVPIKNQRMMIEAFSKLNMQVANAKLIIVGDGELRGDLERLTNEYDVADSVIFTGYQPEPIDFLNIMDVFLLSSFSEGTSMTLLEAMSLAKPCIVTNVGGNAEVIEHSINGLVTPQNNVDAFSSAMIQVATNKELIYQMGENGKKRFEALFSQEQMMSKYHSLYNASIG